MKRLLILTAVIEVPTGMGLVAVPALGAGISLGRVAGVALFALGIACWLASFDTRSCAARGIVSAMVLYNLGVALILSAAGIQSQAIGIALWPAVILHAVMTVWCIASLLRKPA
jgi:hypothetical protein